MHPPTATLDALLLLCPECDKDAAGELLEWMSESGEVTDSEAAGRVYRLGSGVGEPVLPRLPRGGSSCWPCDLPVPRE